MPRKLTKGPAITLRLTLEADQSARSEAERLDIPVGKYIADHYEASLAAKPAPTPPKAAPSRPPAQKPAPTAPGGCPEGGSHYPKGSTPDGLRKCGKGCGFVQGRDGSWVKS